MITTGGSTGIIKNPIKKINDSTELDAGGDTLTINGAKSSVASGQTLTVAGGITVISGDIKSYNYSANQSGWKIDYTGNAEFNIAKIRGTLGVASIVAGGSLRSNVFTSGTEGWIIQGDGDAAFTNVGVAGALWVKNMRLVLPSTHVGVSDKTLYTVTGDLYYKDSGDVTGMVLRDGDAIDGAHITPNTVDAGAITSSTLDSEIVVGVGSSIQSANYNNGWAYFTFSWGTDAYTPVVVGGTIGFPPTTPAPPPNRARILQIDITSGSWSGNNAAGTMYIYITAGSWDSCGAGQEIDILGTYLGNYGFMCRGLVYTAATTPTGWKLWGNGYSQLNDPLP